MLKEQLNSFYSLSDEEAIKKVHSQKYYRANQVINKYATFLDLVMFVLLVTFKSVTYLLFLILNKYVLSKLIFICNIVFFS